VDDLNVSASASTDEARAARLRATMRASELACRTADEVVRNARAAIATSEQRVRSAQLITQALLSTRGHYMQLRAELNWSGDPSLAVAGANLEAATES
jgi:methylphosphotriester-DNA--protein-cysteine methyltransferase